MASWRGVWVCLLMCVRRCHETGGVRVVPTLHVESMAACVCACGWREREEEAGISKGERVGCRGGAAYVWLERRLARSKSFLPSFDGAIQEKSDRDRRRSLLHKEQRVR